MTRLRRVAAFGAVPVVATVGWLVFFRVIYGTFNPAAPYGDTSGPGGTHLQNVPGAFLAVLFDGQFGLLVYAPVLVGAAFRWWRGAERGVARVGWITLGASVLYVAAAMTYWMWWAGNPAPSARFVAVVLPALALPLAVLWSNARPWRRAWLAAVLTVSCVIALVVIGVDRGSLAWNDRDAQAQWLLWLGPVANLRRAWPSFFWRLDINNVGPDNLASEWPFVRHVVVWLAAWALSWAIVRRAASATSTVAARRLAIGLWLTLGLMAAAEAGWWLTGSTGLDAARADTPMLFDARRGASIVETGAHGVHRVRSLAGRLTIATEEPGRLIDPAADWFTLSDAPAGVYDVSVSMKRPAAGVLHVHLGSSTTDVSIAAAATTRFTLRVPADGAVSVEPDAALRASGGRVTLTVAGS